MLRVARPDGSAERLWAFLLLRISRCCSCLHEAPGSGCFSRAAEEGVVASERAGAWTPTLGLQEATSW